MNGTNYKVPYCGAFSISHSHPSEAHISNIIGNNIENHNKFENRGVYNLTCNSCNKFYLAQEGTGGTEHRRDFPTSTGKSTFSEHILNTGHEMRPMEETMTILHFGNDPRKINALKSWKL